MEKIDKSEIGRHEIRNDDGITTGWRDTSVDVLADKINEIVEWINEHDMPFSNLTIEQADKIMRENYMGPIK